MAIRSKDLDPYHEGQLTQAQAIGVQNAIIMKAYNIILAKRHDYSGADDPYGNFRKSELFAVEPWRGIMVRMTDKMSRIQSIMEAGGETLVKDESLFDTFADLVNYSCILAGVCYETLGRAVPMALSPVWGEGEFDADAGEDLGQRSTDRGDDPHAHDSA
jgi:hypothetical protein